MGFWRFLKRWFLGKDWGNGAKDSDFYLFEEEEMGKTSFEDSNHEFSSSLSDSPDYLTDPTYSFLPFNIFHDDRYDTSHDTFNDYFNDTFYDNFSDSSSNTFSWD